MNRLLAVLTLGLVASVAVADVPPPKGFKRVTVDYKITTEKDYPEYAFFTVIGRNRVTPVKLDSKTPLDILAKDRGGRFLACTLVAVPKDASKNYATEKEFHAAVAAGKVEGEVKAKEGFFTQMEVKDTEKRNAIVKEYTLDKIDAKEGIVLVAKDSPKKDNGKDSGDDDSDTPNTPSLASAPRGGLWIAGVAAALAMMFGGLWLVGRSKRKA